MASCPPRSFRAGGTCKTGQRKENRPCAVRSRSQAFSESGRKRFRPVLFRLCDPQRQYDRDRIQPQRIFFQEN